MKLFHHLQDQHPKVLQTMSEHRPRRNRSRRKKKRSAEHNQSFETATTGTTTNSEGRHFHLDMNTVPFILGASTAPSHNVKSNVQNVKSNSSSKKRYPSFSSRVMALLKSHNHQLCLSSKEYSEFLHPHLKGDLSPHTLLYLDHYNKLSSTRPSSASPVRSNRHPISTLTNRAQSASRRPQTATISVKQCHSRIKHLQQEFASLAREHARLHRSRSDTRKLDIISRRMEIILEELETLQRESRKSSSRDHLNGEKSETPLETLRKTRLIQLILKDPANKPHCRGRSHRARPNSKD